MRVTTRTYEKAIEIADFIYKKTGKYYETHSTGFCQQVFPEHAEIIEENFKGQGVAINHQYI